MTIMKVLRNITWGYGTKNLITIYKALIFSLIDYEAITYNSAKHNILNTINPIHNQGVRLITGDFRTTQVNSILCNAGELPLE